MLEWFANQEFPSFALFGRRQGVAIPSVAPDYIPAIREVVRRLSGLGHRRITMLVGRGKHRCELGLTEKAFIRELENLGMATGSYNLPSWDDSREGFRNCLESIFRITPPSALIIEEPHYFFAVLQFCMDRKLRVPQDISLVCIQSVPSFAFGNPPIAHIDRDHRPLVRRMLRWADNVARGKDDIRQSSTKVKFIEGGTIGPASGARPVRPRL